MSCYFTKASVVHPKESHAFISEEPFFYLFSVTIHRLSDDVKVSTYFLEVSAVLKNVDSIDKFMLFIGTDLREQIIFKHYFGINFSYLFEVLFLIIFWIEVLPLFASFLIYSRRIFSFFKVRLEISESLLPLHLVFFFLLIRDFSFKRCSSLPFVSIFSVGWLRQLFYYSLLILFKLVVQLLLLHHMDVLRVHLDILKLLSYDDFFMFHLLRLNRFENRIITQS